jgi:hypothetical protein
MRKRLLLILAFGLLLAQVALLAVSVACRCCPCGTADDDCPRDCVSCVCSSMARLIVPAEPAMRALPLVGYFLPAPRAPQRAADPQEIFHVPRLALA